MSLFILQMCGLLYVALEVKFKLGWKGRCLLLLCIFAGMAEAHRLFGINTDGAHAGGIGYLTRAYAFFIPYAVGLCYWRYEEVRNVLNSCYARFLYVLVVFLMPFIEYLYHPSSLLVLWSSLHGCCISLLLVMALSDMESLNNKVWIPFKQIGKATMVIYVFHWMLLPSFIGAYEATFAEYSPYLQFWINLGAAILISYTCIIIGKCVGVSPLMGFLLLGQRVKKRTQAPAVKVD